MVQNFSRPPDAVLGCLVAVEACHLSVSVVTTPDKIDGHRTTTWWLSEPIRRRGWLNRLLYHQLMAREHIKIARKHPMVCADPWSEAVGWTGGTPPSFGIIPALRGPTWSCLFGFPARKAWVEKREDKETTGS